MDVESTGSLPMSVKPDMRFLLACASLIIVVTGRVIETRDLCGIDRPLKSPESCETRLSSSEAMD